MNRLFNIVDSHVHFWNPQHLDYPWLASMSPLDRAYFPDEYSAATKTANVSKMIFVECGCKERQNFDEANWICELAAGEPRIKGIVAHASLERGCAVRDELTMLANISLVKGVRRNLQSEADPNLCLQPDFVDGVRALAEFGFTFDLCVIYSQLPAVMELVRRCPEIDFILDHCGKPAIREHRLDTWRQQICELATRPNVVCKISGLVTEANPALCRTEDLQPYVTHALDCFGFDRVMFGGDWPVCNLATSFVKWLDILNEILAGQSQADRINFFQTNAERIYRV